MNRSDHELIYGRRPVEEAGRGRRAVHRVWTQSEVGQDEIERLAGSPDHQGLVAEVDPYPYADADAFLQLEDGLVLVLDQVQDPGNLGAIARTAEVAGVDGIVIPERRSASVTAAVCKASAGAVEHLSIARVTNAADWLAEAKGRGYWIWGAEGATEQTCFETDLTGPTVLVMGGEAKGLRPRVAAACDGLISIPQRGRVDSLNVSAAAAVLVYEAFRQRRS